MNIWEYLTKDFSDEDRLEIEDAKEDLRKELKFSKELGGYTTTEMAKNMMAIKDIEIYARWTRGDTPNSIKLIWPVDTPEYLKKYNAVICSANDDSVSYYAAEVGKWAWTARFSLKECANPARTAVNSIYHFIQVSVARSLNGARSSDDMLKDIQ